MTGKQVFNMEEEFSELNCNSSRLEKRFIQTMETLSKQPDKSIWFHGGNRAEAKAIYRIPANEKPDREEILRVQGSGYRTVQHGGTILAVQDTTSLNYNTREKTEGTGYISDKTLGINIRSRLAVTANGLVLGIPDQTACSRVQAKDTRSHESKKARALEEKESFRRVKSLKTGVSSLPEGLKAITPCNREGDMFELFDAAEADGQLFLIHNAKK